MAIRFLRAFVCAALIGWMCAAPARAGVVVRFDPPVSVVNLFDVFTIDIVADITGDPIVGWGLDLTIDNPAIASLDAAPAVDMPRWIAAGGIDGDGLVALANPASPFNGSISGLGIKLATLTFSADALGMTDLILSATPGDLTEGFPRDGAGFVDTEFELGSIEVVPEPASVLVLLVGLALVLQVRGRGSRLAH